MNNQQSKSLKSNNRSKSCRRSPKRSISLARNTSITILTWPDMHTSNLEAWMAKISSFRPWMWINVDAALSTARKIMTRLLTNILVKSGLKSQALLILPWLFGKIWERERLTDVDSVLWPTFLLSSCWWVVSLFSCGSWRLKMTTWWIHLSVVNLILPRARLTLTGWHIRP